MIEYSRELCDERHDTVYNRLGEHKERLNNHGERLDSLEQHRSKVEYQIENLIKKIDDLLSTLYWVLRIILGSGLGFFLWYIKEVI